MGGAPRPHHQPSTIGELFPRATSNEYDLRRAVRKCLNAKMGVVGLQTATAPVTAESTGDAVNTGRVSRAEEAGGPSFETDTAVAYKDGTSKLTEPLERVAAESLSLAFEAFEPRDEADLIRMSPPGTRSTRLHREKYAHTVSAYEFYQALKALGVPNLSPDAVTTAVGNLGLDCDGRVDYRGFVRFVSLPATPHDIMRMAALNAAAEFVDENSDHAAAGLKPRAALRMESEEAQDREAARAFAKLGEKGDGGAKFGPGAPASKVELPSAPSAWSFATPGSRAAGMRPKFTCAWPINFSSRSAPFWREVNALEAAVLAEVRRRATVESMAPEPADMSLTARYGTTGIAASSGAFILRRAFAFFDRRSVREFTLDDLHETLADLGFVDPPFRAHNALTPFVQAGLSLRASAERLFNPTDARPADSGTGAPTAQMSPQEKILPDVPHSPVPFADTPRSDRSRSSSPGLSKSGASSRASSPAMEMQVSSAARKLVIALFRRMHGEGDPGVATMAISEAMLSPHLFEEDHPLLRKPVTYNSFAKFCVPLNAKLRAVCEKMQSVFNTLATRGGGAKDFLGAFRRISGGRKIDQALGISDIRALLGSAAVTLSNSELQTLIDWFDENGNGEIDLFELFTGTLQGWDLAALLSVADLSEDAEHDEGYKTGPVGGAGRGRSLSPARPFKIS